MAAAAAKFAHASVHTAGHLGDLSPQQQEMFDQLRASELEAHKANLDRLAELDRARVQKQSGRPATEEELAGFRKDREDDWPYELLRFLRAQKWDLAKAREAYQAYHAWRVKNGVDTIYDQLPFNAQLIDRIVGNNAAGEDKAGRPIYIEKSGGVNTDAICSLFTDGDILKSHIWQQENSVARAIAATKKHGRKVELFTQIIDLKGLSMAHKRALKFTQAIFQTDAAYYPERLGALYVINAPWVFPVIWAIVKGWIDPITRAKIHIIKDDPATFLLQHIDASQLPAEYGGTCNSCPNSPDCCKQYTLEEALELLPIKEGDVQLTATSVSAGKNVSVHHELQAGEVVEWAWQLDEKADIDFSITFQPAAAGAEKQSVVVPTRIEGIGTLAQGSWQAEEPGTVTIMWDNHFSYWSSKNLKYWSQKTDRRREATIDAAKARAAGAAAAASQ